VRWLLLVVLRIGWWGCSLFWLCVWCIGFRGFKDKSISASLADEKSTDAVFYHFPNSLDFSSGYGNPALSHLPSEASAKRSSAVFASSASSSSTSTLFLTIFLIFKNSSWDQYKKDVFCFVLTDERFGWLACDESSADCWAPSRSCCRLGGIAWKSVWICLFRLLVIELWVLTRRHFLPFWFCYSL
jgi:hypothetical protein